MSDRTLETRALHCLVRYREPGKTPYRLITPAMRADLLGWAATLPDEDLLDMRGVGKTLLRWIREHQPVPLTREPGLDDAYNSRMMDEWAALSDAERLARHEDDSYGDCLICLEWVPFTDNESVKVAWPCAPVRLAALASEDRP